MECGGAGREEQRERRKGEGGRGRRGEKEDEGEVRMKRRKRRKRRKDEGVVVEGVEEAARGGPPGSGTFTDVGAEMSTAAAATFLVPFRKQCCHAVLEKLYYYSLVP